MNDYNTLFSVNGIDDFTDEFLNQSDFRIIETHGRNRKILYNNKMFDILVKSFDKELKSAVINVDGFDFNVKMNEPLDQLINELGFLESSKHSVKELLSPMPGLVVEVFAQVGQEVAEGDKLLSLEAMKMENILKSSSDGIIKSIQVSGGDSVVKGQLLIEFE